LSSGQLRGDTNEMPVIQDYGGTNNEMPALQD
jgi:hypothetical protein